VEKAYDTDVFATFMNGKKDDGVNIDNWEFEDLAEAIREFRAI